MKPHIRKGRGNIDGRWIVDFGGWPGRMEWVATFEAACELVRSGR